MASSRSPHGRRAAARWLVPAAVAVTVCARPGTGSTPARSLTESDASGPESGPTGTRQITEYVNGNWLVGGAFVRGSRRVADGRFVAPSSGPVAGRMDVGGAWMVPAFGDAHTHNLDGDNSTLPMYRHEGVFFVQVLTNTLAGRDRLAPALEGPGKLDVAYANAGITSTYGHPMSVYEPRAMGIGWDELAARREEVCASRLLEGKAYWFVDTVHDLERLWPSIIATNPDVLKIFLLRADQHPAEPDCEDLGRVGLASDVARAVVGRAHRAGLRVWAHVETAADFALAVEIGVDGIAHLPGYDFGTASSGERREDFVIDEEAARRAATAGVVVTPTVSLISTFGSEDSALVATTRALLRENLALLRRYGVELAIGSDWYGRTAWNEVQALADFDLWTPAEVLRIWASVTPRVIFPERRLGSMEPGDEATFLGLACDPRNRLECLRQIEVRVKDGVLIDPADPDDRG